MEVKKVTTLSYTFLYSLEIVDIIEIGEWIWKTE